MSDTTPDDRELSALAVEVLAASAADRPAVLERLCAEYPHHAAELRALVQESPELGERGEHDVASLLDRSMEGTFEQPEWVGPYRILDELGEGGMGVVYVAQERGAVRRHVALKLIKRGMDSERVLRRFEAERQALALMEHENIAKVFCAGASEDGRPYFVMEYVKGIPITHYCDQQRLGVRERIGIFLQVCDGVQHAHQKAVIHRDLKPSNVLVTLQSGSPVAKIIDFGLARATGQRLHEHTLHTKHGAVVGTPEYMSPEQAGLGGLDIDTRSDVYSLGALLYELLTGEPPYLLGRLSGQLDEMLRTIREVDPPTPSSRVSSSEGHAWHRCTDQRSLRRGLRGDLDWITMKALEKDRTRRYHSASELAADLRRHLNDEPVFAGPPGSLYRLRKFARKNRSAVAATAAIALVLVASAAVFAVLWFQAERARHGAERQAMRATAVKEFLRQMLWPDESDFLSSRRDELSLSELLAKSAELVNGDPPTDPEIEAEIREIIGMAYRTLGRYQEADHQLARAYEICQRELEPSSDRMLVVKLRRAIVLELVGRKAEAGRMLQEVYDARLAQFDAAHPAVLDAALTLAINLKTRSLADECEALATRTLAVAREALGTDSSVAGHLVEVLAWCRAQEYRFVEAEDLYREAIRVASLHRESDDGELLRLQNNLADFYLAMDRPEEAEPRLRRVWEAVERQSGPTHPRSLTVLSNHARCRYAVDDFEEATRLWCTVLEERRRSADPAHPATLSATLRYCIGLYKLGRYDEAEPLLRDALPLADASTPGGPLSAVLRQALGNVLLETERTGEAADMLLEALRIARRSIRDPVALASLETDTGHALLVAGESERARELLGSALRAIEGKLPERHRAIVKVRKYLTEAR